MRLTASARAYKAIVIETVDHRSQRYPTTGDWGAASYEEDVARRLSYDPRGDTLLIRVSDMGDWRYEALVGIHEAVEALLCRARGVSEESVSAFDLEYEAKRAFGDESEPGDDPNAPYYAEHQIATDIERILAAKLGVSWQAYEAANLALYADDDNRE